MANSCLSSHTTCALLVLCGAFLGDVRLLSFLHLQVMGQTRPC